MIGDGRIWFPLAAKVETRRVPAIHQLAVQPGCASVMRLPSIWSTFLTKAFGENGLARNSAPGISPPSCSSISSERPEMCNNLQTRPGLPNLLGHLTAGHCL